jgi:hypothetical protein
MAVGQSLAGGEQILGGDEGLIPEEAAEGFDFDGYAFDSGKPNI